MKKFNNIDNQIKLLKSRNLRILNEEKAKENLKLYGYYEIGVPPTIIEFDLEEIFDITLN